MRENLMLSSFVDEIVAGACTTCEAAKVKVAEQSAKLKVKLMY
jgi:hypothetical protein